MGFHWVNLSTITVHDHPTVTQISADFISNTDISPDCDFTNSGNPQLDCSGNPVGAVEEYIYESLPVALPDHLQQLDGILHGFAVEMLFQI